MREALLYTCGGANVCEPVAVDGHVENVTVNLVKHWKHSLQKSNATSLG